MKATDAAMKVAISWSTIFGNQTSASDTKKKKNILVLLDIGLK